MIKVSPNEATELPIDELALLVLQDIKDTESDSEFNYIYWYTDNRTPGAWQTPGNTRNAIYTIGEAVAWLRSHAMIAHKPGDNRPDTMFITRYGQEALDKGLEHIKSVERLQDNLHPVILAKARRQFLIGEYENAVFVSMKAVEVRVRKLAGFGNGLTGTDLMNKAFKANGPLADKSAPAGEVVGTMNLFSGAYAVLRNPSGHREVEYDDVTEASEAVIFASLLMRILDKVEKRIKSN